MQYHLKNENQISRNFCIQPKRPNFLDGTDLTKNEA